MQHGVSAPSNVMRPADLVFQSVARGAPMRDNDIVVRHVKPAARNLRFGSVNCRCLRTSYATWLNLYGGM